MRRTPRVVMDQVVTLQQESTVDDGGGGQGGGWSNVTGLTSVAAAVKPMFGSEGPQAGQVQSLDRYRVTLRRGAALPKAKMRILWVTNANKVLNVTSAPDHGPRAVNIELHCEAGGGH